jgi:hypothetical protein
MEKKKFEKLDKFVAVLDKVFPTVNSYFNFWMMGIFIISLCAFSFVKRDLMGTVLSALGVTYCLNEWAKALKKG